MGTAYADESMRLTGGQPMYLLGATVFHDEADASPKMLSERKAAGAAKMHWRDMGRRAQAESLQIVAQSSANTTVIIATPMNPRKQERARRKCLEVLLPLLEGEGVIELAMESRNPVLDARDIEMVDAMRSRASIGAIMVSHRRGETDPHLWFPDLVLGAYGDALCEDKLPIRWLDAWAAVEKRTALHVIRP